MSMSIGRDVCLCVGLRRVCICGKTVSMCMIVYGLWQPFSRKILGLMDDKKQILRLKVCQIP